MKNIIEKLMLMLISFSVIFIGSSLLFSYVMIIIGYDANIARRIYIPIINLLDMIHRDWTVLMIIPLLIFYQPIYQLIMRIKKIGNVDFSLPEDTETVTSVVEEE
jgi:hypothetical protein